jgi:hypothetical protein
LRGCFRRSAKTHVSTEHTRFVTKYPERVGRNLTTETSHTSHTSTTESAETSHQAFLQTTSACKLTCAYDTSSKGSTDASSR